MTLFVNDQGPGNRFAQIGHWRSQRLKLVGSNATEVTPTSPCKVATTQFAVRSPKMRYCNEILREAERLLRAGRPAPQVSPLVNLASEILDELDEPLVALDPVRDATAFANAAMLHRDLERVQAEIATLRHRRQPFVSD